MQQKIEDDKSNPIKYELFCTNNVLSNQFHHAFDITQKHLREMINFTDLKFEDILKNHNSYIQSFGNDFQCFDEMSRCIELIKNRKSQEIDFVNHYDTLISGFIQNLQIKKTSLENSEDFGDLILQEEKQISELKIMKDKFMRDTKESDLKITYDTLLKTKDEIEISVMINLCSLLLHSTKIDSRTVEKMLRNYSDLNNRMMKFSKSNLCKDDIIEIGNKIKLTVSKIDPSRSEDRILCSTYSHLLPFGLWGIAASEISLYELKKEELKNKLKKLNEEIIPIDLEIQHLEKLKSKLNLENDSKNENYNLDVILSAFEEIKSSILKYARKQLPEEIENKRMYFSKINSNLLMEEDSISDLYSTFKTLSNKQGQISVDSIKNIRNNNNPYNYFGGMCGFLNCLRRK